MSDILNSNWFKIIFAIPIAFIAVLTMVSAFSWLMLLAGPIAFILGLFNDNVTNVELLKNGFLVFFWLLGMPLINYLDNKATDCIFDMLPIAVVEIFLIGLVSGIYYRFFL